MEIDQKTCEQELLQAAARLMRFAQVTCLSSPTRQQLIERCRQRSVIDWNWQKPQARHQA